MALQYQRSRQLDAEIKTARGRWGFRIASDEEADEMRVSEKKSYGNGVASKANVKQGNAVFNRARGNQKPSSNCQQKACYCHHCRDEPDKFQNPVSRIQKESQTQTSPDRPRVTWDQILSQRLNVGTQSQQHPSKMNKSCQVGGVNRPVERPKSLGNEHTNKRMLDDWCHSECFVDDLAINKPGDLLELKVHIDKAVRRLGLRDCLPQEPPRQDEGRSKVVLEYLEELSLEMVKKKFEECESKYKNMKKKLEDALVTQKIEIQSLKSQLFIKSEEVARLQKGQENANSLRDARRRELEFAERIANLDERLKAMMERDEKSNAELAQYKQMVSRLKSDLVAAREERDLYGAKMDIYMNERDKAVASLSVYEHTFKNLKSELGQEIRGIKPSLDLTANSCGTLDTTVREPRVVTSSPNASSVSELKIRDRAKMLSKTAPQSKKRTKHTLAGSGLIDVPSVAQDGDNKENAGEVLLQKLEVLGKEFKQFSDNVIPLALGLDDEANQLLDVSTSTGLSWTDLNSKSLSSTLSKNS